MKKILFATAGSLFLTFSCFAQNTFEIGIKAGVNRSNLRTSLGNQDAKQGFHGGVFANFPLTKHLALQPEMVYSSQGATTKYLRDKITYLSAPIMLQYLFNNQWRIQTGPQISRLLNSKRAQVSDSTSILFAPADWKSFDISWAAGVQYVNSKRWGIDVRYIHGLSDIGKNASYFTKNSSWQLGLLYRLSKTINK